MPRATMPVIKDLVLPQRPRHAGVGDAGALALEPAKNISAANDDDHLHAEIAQLGNLPGHAGDGLGANAEALFAAERLAGELEQDAFKLGLGFGLGIAFHGQRV